MRQSKFEYSKPSVHNSSYTYNTLGRYKGANSTMPPLKSGVTSGVFVTPNWGAPGYDSLNHSVVGGYRPYFTVTDAYGKGSGSCNTNYTTRLCGTGYGTQENYRPR